MRRQRLTRDLEELYRTEYPRFLRVSLAIVGDEAAAHDAVQEAFARALRSAHTYRGEGPLAAWVWSILVNTARAASYGRELPMELATADEAVSVAEEDGDIRDWIASLPERQRLAVFLRYYADLGYREIASALDVETGTVSATLSAAHAALRRSLQEVRR